MGQTDLCQAGVDGRKGSRSCQAGGKSALQAATQLFHSAWFPRNHFPKKPDA